MTEKKKIILEGREIGQTDVKPSPGANIQLESGSQDGTTTYKTYIVESVQDDNVTVRENPLLG